MCEASLIKFVFIDYIFMKIVTSMIKFVILDIRASGGVRAARNCKNLGPTNVPISASSEDIELYVKN